MTFQQKNVKRLFYSSAKKKSKTLCVFMNKAYSFAKRLFYMNEWSLFKSEWIKLICISAKIIVKVRLCSRIRLIHSLKKESVSFNCFSLWMRKAYLYFSKIFSKVHICSWIRLIPLQKDFSYEWMSAKSF